MRTIKLNTVMASVVAAGSLLLTVPALTHADTGQGWDALNAGAPNEGVGQSIPVSDQAYLGTSMKPDGQGWDAFKSGASVEGVGEAIPSDMAAYEGTSLEDRTGDADAFGAGIK